MPDSSHFYFLISFPAPPVHFLNSTTISCQRATATYTIQNRGFSTGRHTSGYALPPDYSEIKNGHHGRRDKVRCGMSHMKLFLQIIVNLFYQSASSFIFVHDFPSFLRTIIACYCLSVKTFRADSEKEKETQWAMLSIPDLCNRKK